MSRRDGRALRGREELVADVVVVGSGPAGAVVARELATAGLGVVVVEEGPWIEAADHPADALGAMALSYRGMGAQVVLGRALMPLVQGRRVGGSAAINGAICWRLPRDVHADWVAQDPALADALPWTELEEVTDRVEAELGVAPTLPEIAGPKNLLLARGADALGLAHRPIRRNVRGCAGLGRCLQGCPAGHKQSPEVAQLPEALARGATLLHDVEVVGLAHARGRVQGVAARAAGGGTVVVRAPRVVLAASAVQTPGLLLASGLSQGPVGRHFQCHPGVSMAGRFPEVVRAWEGATQGHEVIGLRREGLKFEALGHPAGVLASRVPGVGRALGRAVADLDHWADWGVAVRSRTEGRVRRVLGRTVVTWSPSADDVRQFRRGLQVLGELFLAAGAERVAPHVAGLPATLATPAEVAALAQGPRRASAYQGAITHLFGTCRMGSDPRRAVVRPDFRHHHVDGLWIADSSVFPSNTGVNPQVSIMALATICARRMLAA
ncbi:MAG: GMC family oxidoreductase [Alphaproteobacteria bacterium]|nr:GMC family oxidoreductase [Alphaproteobacteria bacterium]